MVVVKYLNRVNYGKWWSYKKFTLFDQSTSLETVIKKSPEFCYIVWWRTALLISKIIHLSHFGINCEMKQLLSISKYRINWLVFSTKQNGLCRYTLILLRTQFTFPSTDLRGFSLPKILSLWVYTLQLTLHKRECFLEMSHLPLTN